PAHASKGNLALPPAQAAGRPAHLGQNCLRRTKAAACRVLSSLPKTADEPASEPRRLQHCSVPMLGPYSRDRTGQAPNTPGIIREAGIRSDEQVRGGGLDREAQAPPPDVTEMKQICR